MTRAIPGLGCNTDGMELAPGIAVDDAALEAFCQTNGVRRLGLFGSALAANCAQTATSIFSWSSSRVGFPVSCSWPALNWSWPSCSAEKSTSARPVT